MRAATSTGGAISRLRQGGFTLVELLVVVSIIAMLASVLGATLKKVRHATQSYACKNKLKTVSFEFGLFADDYGHGNRGDSDQLGRTGFHLADFQEKLYRVAEFWEAGTTGKIHYAASREPLICPSGPRGLEGEVAPQCDSALNPKDRVSVGFNMRLHLASIQRPGSAFWILEDVRLTSAILEQPWTPLAFDVDGVTADKRRRLPFYSAPAMGDRGHYKLDQYWYPSMRHGQEMNAGFIGGHVLASRKPLQESSWDWSFQPPPVE